MKTEYTQELPKGAVTVNTERCKGCGLCVGACPKNVLALAEKKVNKFGYHYAVAVEPGVCVGCASCAIVCPDACITVYRPSSLSPSPTPAGRGAVGKALGVNGLPDTSLTPVTQHPTPKLGLAAPLPAGERQGERLGASEPLLMKGNEALAHACVRCGADGYFGYPITPQSEVIETLAALKPWETTGMVVVQAESEVAAINMVYGGAGAGKRVLTSSSSPGIALMQEGIAYMAGAELPGVIVNVQRGGPGLGTIQPSQGDYFQATRGGGNGDYCVVVLAPASVQEMADFVGLAFTLAFRYRIPAMILSDGVIGQMMERVVLPPVQRRRTEQEVAEECPWAATGRPSWRKPNVITSLELKPEVMEQRNLRLQRKYAEIEARETRFEAVMCADADVVVVAFGSVARIARKAVDEARARGVRAGLFRPITLWPFPSAALRKAACGKRGLLVAEMNAGQMIQDVRLAVGGTVAVEHFGRLGGIVPEPEEIVESLRKFNIRKQ